LDQFLSDKSKKIELKSQTSEASLEELNQAEINFVSRPTVKACLRSKQIQKHLTFDKIPKRNVVVNLQIAEIALKAED